MRETGVLFCASSSRATRPRSCGVASNLLLELPSGLGEGTETPNLQALAELLNAALTLGDLRGGSPGR